jgi:hypothetical protein
MEYSNPHREEFSGAFNLLSGVVNKYIKNDGDRSY